MNKVCTLNAHIMASLKPHVLRSKALKVQHAQVVRIEVARVQMDSPLKGLGE